MIYTCGKTRIGQLKPTEYRGICLDIPLNGGAKTLSIEFGSDGGLTIYQLFKEANSIEYLASVQMSFSPGIEADTVVKFIKSFDRESTFDYFRKWEEDSKRKKEDGTKDNS